MNLRRNARKAIRRLYELPFGRRQRQSRAAVRRACLATVASVAGAVLVRIATDASTRPTGTRCELILPVGNRASRGGGDGAGRVPGEPLLTAAAEVTANRPAEEPPRAAEVG